MNNLMLRGVTALWFVAVLTVAACAQDTAVHLAYGDWIAAALPTIGAIVGLLVVALLGVALRYLPPWAQAIVSTTVLTKVQALAADAIEWGVQAAQGAVKGKEITIDVGNEIVAAAVQNALDTWPKAVIDKLGGADGVKQAIIKQLENSGVILPKDSTAAEVLDSSAVASVTTANP